MFQIRASLTSVEYSYVLEARRRVSKSVSGDLLFCCRTQVVLKGGGSLPYESALYKNVTLAYLTLWKEGAF